MPLKLTTENTAKKSAKAITQSSPRFSSRQNRRQAIAVAILLLLLDKAAGLHFQLSLTAFRQRFAMCDQHQGGPLLLI